MRITVKRLRYLVAALACLLVVVLGGFLLYARYRIRHFGKDLPGKLGVNIQQTANGFTYSQSDKGHTIFTIHASKLVQFKGDGHATLHDVSITLYGPPGSNREDRVYGSDFDYDQKNGIASATGDVQIDLQSPQRSVSQPASKDSPPAEKDTIHVKASGVVFTQKTGLATTNQLVQFRLPNASGEAVGATFDSKQGVLVLDKQVVLTSSSNGEPSTVHASHAQIDRDTRQVFLLNAQSDFKNERSSADQATVYLREDGSAQRITAKGNVHTVLSGGAQSTSQAADVALDNQSQPTQVQLAGGVNFIDSDAEQSMHGNAVEGTITFTPGAVLHHAQFRDAVSFVDQQLKLPNDPHGSATRQITASKLDIDFAPGPDKKATAQKALATGGAVATLRTISSKAPEENTTIRADQLLATLAGGRAIRQLDGSGHTQITEAAQDGSSNVSTGDVLHVLFTPQAAPAKARVPSQLAAQTSQIDTAGQEGNVTLAQTPAKNAKMKDGSSPLPLHATAVRAEYSAGSQLLKLTGNPRINNGAVDLTAQTVDYHRDTGDATAQGDVKATYLHAESQRSASAGSVFGGQGPVHIIAAQADLQHSTGDSIFRGQARMWQNANAVTAPVIELSRTQQTLKAHGDSKGGAQSVGTTISSLMGTKRRQSVVRVQSRTLNYADRDRRGDFDGDVTAVAPDGTIRSDRAQFFLQPEGPQKAGQSQIDKIIAKGRVVLSQPGRKGEGDQLVYTSTDGRYVLTGTAASPPRISDAAHGTTTGSALIFNDQDDSVEVSGGQSAAVTKTRAPK
ncbi:LptA/OstA family protein [Acidobacterium sp. S8]|uniref:LptA/OstA family protein n=1 Tax=Acidobacterium sp. S8 TaxID=1641854 RepID=UPI00131B439A|nr:LptA/OstA family protein [Acidobacterium sp. S8]